MSRTEPTFRAASDVKVGDVRLVGGRVTAVRTSASGKTVFITSEQCGTERLAPMTRIAVRP
jgi:hypothetical protein